MKATGGGRDPSAHNQRVSCISLGTYINVARVRSARDYKCGDTIRREIWSCISPSPNLPHATAETNTPTAELVLYD